MEKQKIGKIIFSKVLKMSLIKYLIFIEEIPNRLTTKPFSAHEYVKKKLFYAKVMTEDGTLCFKVSDKRLETIYSVENWTPLDSKPRRTGKNQRDKHLTGCTENKIICSFKWINTRNKFSLHILKSLLDYQCKYWFFGRETDLKPLTLKQFLSLYPLEYLEQSRLSRLIQNLSVMNLQNQIINLRNLFISQKKSIHILLKKSLIIMKMP